ncbi:bifunctional proline dehydrogenase/L-glutamate gamma-semialdehyde dehydrogenase PutA [Acidocella facilis]|uniref:bifunctional proline dehydrogenase/L-glutamate gamma-semialdehyde dehydrogenase PutA n=1 Tax=Acidocella facilis TaxID=525 RepID=UPI00047CD664|nr:bifunctional proline dehydrogenase/L-glutamate gamma-semialdehyde dehydrogenase PutA [Acidocella facilis]
MIHAPLFAAFAPPIGPQTALRQAITAAYRRAEPDCMAPLLAAATLAPEDRAAIAQTATALVTRLRAQKPASPMAALMQDYALSSEEGIALMCLAEALLRIPDAPTRDALIRDKLAGGDWGAHLGAEKSLFVNAASWGLALTGRLVAPHPEASLGAALTRLVGRAGEPLIRAAMDRAMRHLGAAFVSGQTIQEALAHGRPFAAKGFRYSYDMLGEAALTAQDATRYFADYEAAIHAIGQAAAGKGVIAGPGISIKLSALHPRYGRAQAGRVMAELLPRLRALALLSKRYDIGLNIDAEEADRLELSLDLLEALALDPVLAGWQGLGFVIQAYGKRCPSVIAWLVDLARRAKRRLTVRLVKGAYWDAEIKRAQQDGLADFPVYTRKLHTDVAYIACARALLAAPDAIFPQFATHNAQTLATIHHLAGPDFHEGQYEFQCLHGMGEPLYEQMVGSRPCRIYAPVGTHETLLAYLVRRLLENGANSSFVNRIADPAVPVAALVADPTQILAASPIPGAPHEKIAVPAALYPDRRNSSGIDLSDETTLASLSAALQASAATRWQAAPAQGGSAPRLVLNPADLNDIVGEVRDATPAQIPDAMRAAAAANWQAESVAARAAALERAADLLEARSAPLLGLIIREAGKTMPNAIAEIREAVDFLRYYAVQARTTLQDGQAPLGPVVCISPWNFPLAIFTGQIAAALAAGNVVLAKPAEETPLIAAQAVAILHEAGIPPEALQLLPGDGAIGAALVAAPEVAAVMFTGSTEVARLIQAQHAGRLTATGQTIPLIAETGGQNAMIVDSTALPEQVVADVLLSGFDSAGQRCSALRVLCLQEEAADRILTMLKGAMAELRLGRPDALAVDIGPVISAQAKAGIEAHIAALRKSGAPVTRLAAPAGQGHFVAPTLIEVDHIAQLEREVFGPVLHVLRYRRAALPDLISAINATGYGLTFGLHTRLAATEAAVTSRIKAGNLYVNRNMVGAVVGVQPFGGRGLSGTGPKAGGPLYLSRLVREPALPPFHAPAPAALLDFIAWADAAGEDEAAALARLYAASPLPGVMLDLPGPVGERNRYALHPRGALLLRPATLNGLYAQVIACLATGNRGCVEGMALPALPPALAQHFTARADEVAAVLAEAGNVQAVAKEIANRPGAVLPVHALRGDQALPYLPEFLVEEVSLSINLAAAGGNASLMML